MVRYFLILENSETEFSVDPRNGRRNNTTRSSLQLMQLLNTGFEIKGCRSSNQLLLQPLHHLVNIHTLYQDVCIIMWLEHHIVRCPATYYLSLFSIPIKAAP